MLPFDVCKEIFTFLPIPDRESFGVVCKYTREIYRGSVVRVTLCIDTITATQIDHLAAVFPAVTSAKLITDLPFLYFPMWDLTSLRIVNSTPVCLDTIENYRNLRELTLSQTADLSPVLLLPALEKLQAKITETSREIRVESMPSLRELSLQGQIPFGLWSNCGNLVKLNVHNNIINSNIALPRLEWLNCLSFRGGLDFPSLETLAVTFGDELRSLTAPKLTSLFVNVLPGEASHFRRFPRLENLWINSTTVSTVFIAPDLASLPLKKLSLTMPRTVVPSEADLRRIIGIPTLEKLQLFPTTTRHIFTLDFWRPGILRNIRILNLANSNIPDSVLVTLDAIENLTIPGSMNITDYGVVTLVSKRREQLKHICVTDCPSLTAESHRIIAEFCESYTV